MAVWLKLATAVFAFIPLIPVDFSGLDNVAAAALLTSCFLVHTTSSPRDIVSYRNYIVNTSIKNTSNTSERQDFWEKAEKNLLQALMHYVQSQKIPGTNRLLPIEQRSLGTIYRMLSNESFNDLDTRFEMLPKSHPAKAPYGIFKLANRQIWGNIAIGLGNRLSVFQNTQRLRRPP